MRFHGRPRPISVPRCLRADQTLNGWDTALESAVRGIYNSRQTLQRMDATWAATEAEARQEQVLPALLDRITTLRASIAETSTRSRAQLDVLLATQNEVATVRVRIADGLSRVARADQLGADELFEVESVPLWKLLGRPAQGEKLRQQILQSLRIHALALTDFMWVQSGRALLLLGALVLLTVALRRGRGKLEAEMSADPDLVTAVEVLLHPFAAASLLTLALAGLILEHPPLVVSQVILIGMMVAFFAAGRSLVPERARRSTYALAIIVAVQLLSSLAPELSLLRRSLLLAVSLSSMAVMIGELRRRGWESELPTPRWRPVLRAALMVGSLLLLVSAVANVLGNMTLATLLTRGTLGSAAAGLLLSGVFEVLQGLLVIVLRSRRVNRWPLVRDNAAMFRARGVRLLRWLVAGVWIYATTHVFSIGAPVWTAVQQIVWFRVRVGSLDLSLGDLLAFAFTLWIAILLSRLVAFGLEEGLANRGLARGVPAAISRTASYAVIAVGTFLAFLASGMELTKFTVILGTLGVGIGFGLQNVVNNFVSGLILLYERPVQVGDVIEVGKVTGVVRRIGIRSSTVATPQGAEVVVPNANLISNEVINWTLSDRRRRADIDVGVAYGTPPEKVRSLLLQVAGAHPEVIKFPEPLALFTGFGDSALNFQLLVWTAADTWGRVASELRTEICRILEQEGISIPFPQRDLHLVSVDASVAETLRGKEEPGAEEPGDVGPVPRQGADPARRDDRPHWTPAGAGRRARDAKPSPFLDRLGARLEQLLQRLLRRGEGRLGVLDQLLHLVEVLLHHRSLLEAAEHAGLDVAALAHRRGVPELRRSLLHRLHHALPHLSPRHGGDQPRIVLGHAGERAGTDQRPGPGAEVLGGEFRAHHVVDVLVEVVAPHGHRRAVVGDEPEQLLPRQLPHLADDARHAPIAELPVLPLTGLARVVEGDQVALHRHVSIEDGRQSVVLVAARVRTTARSHEARRQHADGAGHHLVPAQAAAMDVAGHPLAHPRERVREVDQLPEFPPVLPLAKTRVVAVLPAAGPVLSHRLELGGGRGCHVDVGPRRGDGELADPLQLGGGRRPPGGSPEGESLAGTDAADSRALEVLQGGHAA